jgi:hypothetical protein
MATFKVQAVYEIAPDTDRIAKRKRDAKTMKVEVFVRARNAEKASEEAYFVWVDQFKKFADHEWMSDVVEKVNGRGIELNTFKVLEV